jgi:hypothetical protein
LLQLGLSLQGAAKLLGVAAHYVVTGKYVKKTPALAVKISAGPARPNCYEVVANIATVVPALPLLAPVGTKMVEHLTTFILAKLGGRRKEMEIAAALMTKAMEETGATSRASIEAMRDVAMKMADAQRPAARLFVSPVGQSCEVAKLGSAPEALSIDRATRAVIDAAEIPEITNEKAYRVLISELDLKTRSRKVSFEADEDTEARYPGEITDPAISLPNNVYAITMAARQWLDVKAKLQLKDGEIDKVYVSNSLSAT